MVLAADRPDLQAIRGFTQTVARLRWSSRALTGAVQAYAGKLRTLSALTAPDLCADVRSWAAGGFRALPRSTAAFDSRFMPAWVALGELPAALTPYEGPAEKTLVRRANQLEAQLTEGEARAV